MYLLPKSKGDHGRFDVCGADLEKHEEETRQVVADTCDDDAQLGLKSPVSDLMIELEETAYLITIDHELQLYESIDITTWP